MQSEITIALAVPHTPWVPARVESLGRLKDALGIARDCAVFSHPSGIPCDAFLTLADRAANHEWSAEMWTWGAQARASHFLTLQDDVVPMPGFWHALRAMLEAVPDQVIGLQVPHPAAPALAAEGNRWFTTSDMLIGCAYVMPRALLAEFLTWRATALKPGALEAITEDTLIGVWCLATGRKIWHPLPTIVDHDTTLASTYGNDAHQGRRSLVRWDGDPLRRDLGDPRSWYLTDTPPPALGRFYDATPSIAYEWVEGFGSAAFTRARQDDGSRAKRGIGLRLRARNADRPRPSIFIATPTQGAPAPQFVSMLMRILVASEFDVVDAYDLAGLEIPDGDIVRVRSRLVRLFLETDCTHLLFLDDDVSSVDPVRLIAGMLAAKRDVLLAPYPRRDGVNFALAHKVASHGIPAEAGAYRYAAKLLGNEARLEVEPDGCAEVEGLGLGCALIRREVLERMVTHYRDELGFDDGAHGPTVALFQLILRERALLSEDYSFCARWRAMGGKVHMYLGAGAPLNHTGQHVYRGAIEAFGLRRDGR